MACSHPNTFTGKQGQRICSSCLFNLDTGLPIEIEESRAKRASLETMTLDEAKVCLRALADPAADWKWGRQEKAIDMVLNALVDTEALMRELALAAEDMTGGWKARIIAITKRVLAPAQPIPPALAEKLLTHPHVTAVEGSVFNGYTTLKITLRGGEVKKLDFGGTPTPQGILDYLTSYLKGR